METTDEKNRLGKIKSFIKTKTDFLIEYETGESAKLTILNRHVFRYHMSPTGNFPEYPTPNNNDDEARINHKRVSEYETEPFKLSLLEEDKEFHIVDTNEIRIQFDKTNSVMSIVDRRTDEVVLKEYQPIFYDYGVIVQELKQHNNEYFFGGGMQNGRFSHKSEVIEIVNNNEWDDGGIASPCPFFWSTRGYGVLRNTWQPGNYDFGSENEDKIETMHYGEDFDAFYFINKKPKDILNDYFELTGFPIFMPEYAFYEAHLNAFNRDYWVKVTPETKGAILFEDGEFYKSFQPSEIGNKKGILESLNGENNNYQFSARAMVDRYRKHDMPLGWFIPNDGYGSGYGQTDTLDGDIENLREFVRYSNNKGVQVALWTESNLEPKDPKNPKKGERDLCKEISVAGVVALKCDVAWIGSGYSFGLNAVEKSTNKFTASTRNKARPLIIMVDGWAGTQRYAGIWSGDQSGGEWEYIRFHIPTYIGTGLSGQPVVGSDMDGIYGGGHREINIRDYQWKTFTPLQLNMDGWGNTPKTPFSFDVEATNINRAYLKLKSMLLPYNYTIGHESTKGLPMIRGMFLEFPDEIPAYTLESQYQYMWGPSLLVAPIYCNNKSSDGDSMRHGIYLPNPKQIWIDLFTGEKYIGGKIYNNFNCPLWKIPVFVKDGAIIPFVNPNNNVTEVQRDKRIIRIYPNNETTFDIYEDDGITTDYLDRISATTRVNVEGPPSNERGDLYIHIHKTKGFYRNMAVNRSTILQIIVSKDVELVEVLVKGESIKINKVETDESFEKKENIYYYKKDFYANPYLANCGGEAIKQKCVLIKIQKVDITIEDIIIKVNGFANETPILGNVVNIDKNIKTPASFTVEEKKITGNSITLKWNETENADYYEIEKDSFIYSYIIGDIFTFNDLKCHSAYSFRIRAVSPVGVSKWSYLITVETAQSLYENALKDVQVSCNIPCEGGQEVHNLTNGKKSIWHTCWSKQHQAYRETGGVIRLTFDLGDIYPIKLIEYTPRQDAGNGTILLLQYKCSIDGEHWTKDSDPIKWDLDNKVKTIALRGDKFRYIQIHILKSIGGFGSGESIRFYP